MTLLRRSAPTCDLRAVYHLEADSGPKDKQKISSCRFLVGREVSVLHDDGVVVESGVVRVGQMPVYYNS